MKKGILLKSTFVFFLFSTLIFNSTSCEKLSSETKPTPDSKKSINESKVTANPKEIIKSFTNDLGMTFVWIKPGTFMMGSPESEEGRQNEETLHEVTLTKGFYMQTTEVTQGQWKKVMGNNPSEFKNCGENCQVENVSWYDAKNFIKKLNSMDRSRIYRLPTEAEWEYACRAGTDTPFNTGSCLSSDQANYDGEIPPGGCPGGEDRHKTIPVGSFSPNAWGLYDMHGNVWEWCEDLYGDYQSGAVSDPVGPSSGKLRIYRGGGWSNFGKNCRSANRDRFISDSNYNALGLRLVCTPAG